MVQVTGSVEEGHQICLVGCGKVQKKELVKLTFFVLFAVSCSFPLLERLGVAEQVAPVSMDDAADGDDHSDSAAVGRTADDGHQMCWYLANENAAAVASRYIPYYSWAEDLSVVDPYCGCFCLNDRRLLLSCCAITGCWYCMHRLSSSSWSWSVAIFPEKVVGLRSEGGLGLVKIHWIYYVVGPLYPFGASVLSSQVYM